ncbi:MAG TPA: ferritin-like domain-containing protein [Acidimicrobiales bacterium]|nr:ferritin-like domain-containing protein [Acidimicrobiales bacterium]
MTSSTDPSRRHLLVGAGVGAAVVALGAVPVLSGVAHAQSVSNLTGPDLQLTLFHRSIELAFVEIYGMAIDKKLLDADETKSAALFQSHHNEHAVAAGSLAGVGAVGTNGQMVNTYAGRIRVAKTVDALLDVLFDLETRASSTYLLACGTYEVPRAASFASAVLSVEAQHATVIGSARGLPVGAFMPAFESIVGAYTPAEFPVLT